MNAQHEHKLARQWSLYYSPGIVDPTGRPRPAQATWKHHAKVCTFGTIEDFWRLFLNLVDVSTLVEGGAKRDLFLFEEGIAPDWDDPQIQHGGLWLAHSSDVVARDPDNPSASYTLHDAWMDTVMHAIGEQFPDSYHVAGVALNIRKNGSRLSLWTRGTKNEAAEKVVGRDFKNILHMPPQKQVGYSSFNDSKVASAEGKMYWSAFKGNLRV